MPHCLAFSGDCPTDLFFGGGWGEDCRGPPCATPRLNLPLGSVPKHSFGRSIAMALGQGSIEKNRDGSFRVSGDSYPLVPCFSRVVSVRVRLAWSWLPQFVTWEVFVSIRSVSFRLVFHFSRGRVIVPCQSIPFRSRIRPSLKKQNKITNNKQTNLLVKHLSGIWSLRPVQVRCGTAP